MFSCNKLFRKIIAIIISFAIVITSSYVNEMSVLAQEETSSDQSNGSSEETTIVEEIEEKREPNIKHFKMSDGSFAAYVYDEDVHVLQSDGTYSEIDNSLEDLGQDLAPKNGKNNIKLAKNTNSSKLVKMSVGNYKLSWNFKGINKTKIADIVNPQSEDLSGDEKHLVVKNSTGKAVYKDAFDDIDLEYIINNDSVKENVILKSKKAQKKFTIEYSIDKLTAIQTDEQTITLYDGDTAVFKLTAPIMTDNVNQSSNNIYLKLVSQKNKKLTVELVTDEQWLNSDERVYPVVLDPAAIFVLESDDISYKYSYTNTSVTENAPGTLYVGYSMGYMQTCCSAIKLNTLPSLTAGDMVYKATFNLYLNHYNYQSGYDASAHPINVDLYQINGSWSGFNSSNIYVKGAGPSYYSTVYDYTYASAASGVMHTYSSWDITKLVKMWYNGTSNNGFVLRASNTITTDDNLARYSTPENSPDGISKMPAFAIWYLNHKGLENYWSYTTQDFGTSGAGYVNNYTGNVVLNLPGIETGSASFPAGVDLYYNGIQSATHFPDSICGAGWKLNYDIRVTAITPNTELERALRAKGYYYTYQDSDGTVHYLKSTASDYSNNGTYKDEDGIGLTLVRLTTGEHTFSLTDKDNNQIYLNYHGKVTTINNKYSNDKIIFEYDSNNQYLQKITDGAGHTLTFTRSDTKAIIGITNDFGQTLTFGYSGKYLSSLTYPDGETVSLSYNGNGLIDTVVCRDKRAVKYTYYTNGTSANTYRVKKVTELSIPDSNATRIEGNSVSFAYQNGNYTQITNTDGKVFTYNFDTCGRNTDIIDETGAVSINYIADGENSLKNNKVEKTTTAIKSVDNLLTNTSFENKFTNWTVKDFDSVSAATASTAAAYIGAKSVCFNPSRQISKTNLYQNYTPTKTGDYTFSVYYKTNGLTGSWGLEVMFGIIYSDGSATYLRSTPANQNTNGEWDRLSITGTVTENVVRIQGIISYQNSYGAIYVDCAQMEYGPTVNEYNLVQNSSFMAGIDGWGSANLATADTTKAISSLNYGTNAPNGITNAFVFTGNAAYNKSVSQTIPINMAANKTAFSFSGYGGGNSIARKNGVVYFGIDLCFNYSDGTKEYAVVHFNYYNNSWQYISQLVMPSKANQTKQVTSVTVYLLYYKNRNSAAITGINLMLDKTGAVYSYDEKGNVQSAKDTANRESLYTVDTNNRLTSSTDAENTNYTYTYNTDNAAIGATKYQVKSALHSGYNLLYEYEYDSHGNVIGMSAKNNSDSTKKIAANSTYSANGDRLLTVTDNTRNTITYGYSQTNENDLRVHSVTQNGNTVNYTYKPNTATITGVSTSVTGVDGTVKNISTQYSYLNDRLTSIAHNGFNYNLTYDLFGNRLNTFVGSRTLITNTYETGNGNLIKSTYGNGAYTENVYDEYDRVIAVKQNGTISFKYEYDASGRVYKMTDLVNNKTYTYTYDLLGRTTKQNSSDGSVIKNTYNNLDQTTKTYYNFNGSQKQTSFTYYTGGLSNTTTYPNGAVKSRTLNGLTQVASTNLKTKNNKNFATNIGYLTITQNSTEYVTNVVNSVNHTAINRQINYGYDSAGNIISVTYANGSNQAVNNTYVYDELNQLIRENNSDLNQTITYSYDGGGNILTKTIYPYTTGSLDGLSGAPINYAYTDSEWKDLLTSYNGNTITYDSIGNPLVYKNGELLTWQNGRRLASLTGADGTVLSFKYNENGIRTRKTVNGTVTEYFLNGNTIIAQKTGNNVMWYYYDSTGTREAVEYNGSVYYYYYNAQGDVLGLIDEDLNVVVEYTYDSWGRVMSVSGSLAGTLGQDNPFRYRGYYYDTETGLYYLNSRYYDPEIGRFINADSLIDNRGIITQNLFQYCGNNPVNNADPSGNLFGAIVGIGLLVIGMVATLSGCSSKPAATTSTPSTPSKPSTPLSSTSSTTPPHIPTPQEKSYAATVYAEAGGQNKRSKQAVAHVMNNRIGTRSSWTDIEAVISAPYQFEGYNSPMYRAAMDYYDKGICDNSIDRSAMDECLAVVIPIYSGAEADITGGALYFHSFPNPSDWPYHNSLTQVYVSGTEKFWFYK